MSIIHKHDGDGKFHVKVTQGQELLRAISFKLPYRYTVQLTHFFSNTTAGNLSFISERWRWQLIEPSKLAFGINMAISAKQQREYISQIEVLDFKRDALYEQIKTLYKLSLEVTIESENVNNFKSRLEKLEGIYCAFNKTTCDLIKIKSLL